MTIEDFLEILEQRDLVPQSIVEQVRTKIEKGDRRITPKSLLKYLVKKELVTKRQAKELLQTTLTVSHNAESSILGMVPMPKLPEEKPSKTKPPAEEIPTIMPVDDNDNDNNNDNNNNDSDVLATEEGSRIGADLFGEKPSSLLAESLSKIGVGTDPTLDEAIHESKLESNEPKTKKRRDKKKKVNGIRHSCC